MNREEKLELIYQEERLAEQRSQTQMDELQTLLTTPSFGEERFPEPFQTYEIEVGERNHDVWEMQIPPDKAGVVTGIANEWYPGMELELIVDNTSKMKIERETAEPNNPKEESFIAKNRILWRASNEGSEARNIGVFTEGYFVPVEAYEKLSDLYKKYEGLGL
jgi:hypothetical protein